MVTLLLTNLGYRWQEWRDRRVLIGDTLIIELDRLRR